MIISNMKTNGVLSPLGIDTKKPRFSWQTDGKTSGTVRVLVASRPDLLSAQAADMWDSGQVRPRGFGILYGGKPLRSCTRYFWKVYADGAESEPAWFETAFLSPDEFKAEWIGMPLGFAGATDNVRLDFTVDRPVRSARLYAAALGTGRFYLNGELLADTYFDGAISTYRKTVYYRTYELRPVRGNNALCVEIGNGFYGAKKLRAVMRVVFEDGTVSVTPTMAGRVWNVKKGAITGQSVYDGETYDARREEDWRTPSYRVRFGHWVATFAVDPPQGKMRACPIPAMKVTDSFAPLSVEKRQGGILIDAGKNVCGFLSVTVAGERGARVVLRHAERLRPDGTLDVANLRAAECVDTYILKGGESETYAPQFTYHGFRYAFIETHGDVTVQDVRVLCLRTDVAATGKFRCSDDTLNRLHDMAWLTESNNLNGVFTDCPQRDERLGWLNDLSSRIFEAVCNFSLDTFLPHFVDMITEAQDERGAIPDTVPFTVGCDIADPISAYILLGGICHDLYGDVAVLRRNYRGFAKWMDFLRKLADDDGGVLTFSLYGDWCPARLFAGNEADCAQSVLVPKEFMSGSYFLWYCKQMQKIARVLGKTQDAKKYARDYETYKRAFDAKYYRADTKLYGSGQQTECAVALTVFTEADEETRAHWAKTAADDIVRRGYHMTCGNQGYRHLFFRLADYGYTDVLLRLLKNPEYPGYGFMLSRGATTVWERWEDEVGTEMHSFNHPMFAGYDGFFYNYLAGIRLFESTDACKHVVIAPVLTDMLSFAEAEVETVRGKISSHWHRDGDAYILRIEAPADSTVTVRVPHARIECGGASAVNEWQSAGGALTVTVHKL